MKITAKDEYGLRCLLQVARAQGEDHVTIPQVAEREGLTAEYAAKMLHELREAGLIRSFRGIKGGYVLVKPAEQISVWDVLVGLSGGLYDQEFCGQFTGERPECVRNGNCGIRPVWASVFGHLERAFSRVSLADLMRDERAALAEVERHFDRAFTAGRA